jgi:NADPH2:quinone reductase
LLCGKRVAVLGSRTGTWATHAIASARQVVPVGKQLSDDQAAMFFVNPATAWILTSALLGLQRGDTLVQSAAASNVGRMVVRLGQRMGFETINIVRRESQAELLRSLGANTVIVSQGPGLGEELKRRQPNGVLHAIDPVGGLVASEIAGCLGPRGQLILYGTLSEEPISVSPRSLMTPAASITGFWLGEFMRRQSLLSKLRIVRSVSRLVGDGTLASESGQHFPLDQIAAAVEHAEQPSRAGKTILVCGGT